MKINIKAMAISATVVVWLIVVMTILGETFASFEAFLAQLAGHHWTAKSLIAAVVFILATLILKNSSEDSGAILKSVIILLASVVLGGLIIFLYFAWGFLAE